MGGNRKNRLRSNHLQGFCPTMTILADSRLVGVSFWGRLVPLDAGTFHLVFRRFHRRESSSSLPVRSQYPGSDRLGKRHTVIEPARIPWKAWKGLGCGGVVWGPGRLTGWAHKMPDKSPSWLAGRGRSLWRGRSLYVYEGGGQERGRCTRCFFS